MKNAKLGVPPTPPAVKRTSSPGQTIKVLEATAVFPVSTLNADKVPTGGISTVISTSFGLGCSQSTPLRELKVTIRYRVVVTIPVVGV